MTAADRSLDQLTALRFVAAFAVMLSHLDFLGETSSSALHALYDLVLRQGYCGVSFFYILSGFILTHAYRDRLKSGEISRPQFLYCRATRIFPLHWAVSLAFLLWVVMAKNAAPDPFAIALNFTLLHSWSPASEIHYSLNGPSWSLSNELFFYLCFPLLILLKPARIRLLAMAGLIAVCAAALVAAVSVQGYSALVEWCFYVFPVTRLLEFLVGIILYDLYRSGKYRRWAGTRTEAGLALALLATIGLCATMPIPLSFRYQLIFIPVMAAAVLAFAYGRGRVSQSLRSRAAVRLGEASFALYLTHRPIMTAARGLAGHEPVPSLFLAVGLLLVCALISLAVFRLFERPVMSWLRGLPAPTQGTDRAMAHHGPQRSNR